MYTCTANYMSIVFGLILRKLFMGRIETKHIHSIWADPNSQYLIRGHTTLRDNLGRDCQKA